jgi:YegS/Rv2252/BmrU family lipid kinase
VARPLRFTSGVPTVAVIAHAGKTFGGGLSELRRVLDAEGVRTPIWHEVPQSKKAPRQVRRAIRDGADLILVWGGDGMVRRCIDAVEDAGVDIAVLPAGTSNLFANHFGIPQDVHEAVRVALRGDRRRIDVGRFQDERFATMAGAGFDAAMIRGADDLKRRLGRAAYVVSGARNLRAEAFGARIKVDGALWYDGPATCVLVGNIGDLFAGVEVFPDASVDDGLLDVAVMTAEGTLQVARTVVRTAVGDPQKSPFVRMTKARTMTVRLDREVLYELDGGDRKKVRKFTVEVEPGAVTVRVPRAT